MEPLEDESLKGTAKLRASESETQSLNKTCNMSQT